MLDFVSCRFTFLPIRPTGYKSSVDKFYCKVDEDLSCLSSFAFVLIPPGAVNPPIWPSLRTIRWQGIINGKGFLASAFPTALAALVRPIFFARAEYVITSPNFIPLQAVKTEQLKLLRPSRTIGISGLKFTQSPSK